MVFKKKFVCIANADQTRHLGVHLSKEFIRNEKYAYHKTIRKEESPYMYKTVIGSDSGSCMSIKTNDVKYHRNQWTRFSRPVTKRHIGSWDIGAQCRFING